MRIKSLSIIIVLIIIIIIVAFISSYVRFLTVTGTSMNPEITQDDIVIVVPTDFKYLKTGDIVTYRRDIKGESFMFSHRIIDIENDIIKTKGDNMPMPDEYDVISKDVVGKVIGKIPYVGYIIRFVHSMFGYLIFILIPAIILIVKEIKKMINKS